MTRDPAVMSVTEEKGVRDSLYVGADILRYRAIPMCDIPEGTVKSSEQRLKDLSIDPVSEYRKKAAEAAAKAAEEAAKNDPNRPPVRPAAQKPAADKPAAEKPAAEKPADKPLPAETPAEKPAAERPAPADTLATPADTLPAPADTLAAKADTLAAKADTLAAPADTLAAPEPKDTTKMNFIWGSGNVKMFRKDMQMASDSRAYTDLDSLVRMYRDPVFYNEGNRQYAADSIMMVIHNKRAEKAHLLSNAFITIQEDEVSYDQIRGAEMVAYFDSTSALTRFDALGGAATIFFLVENNALATVNKVESKMIYATFKDGDIERMYYYDNPKNDGYPTVQLTQDDKQLKGYRWEPERRPASPLDVTSLVPRPSERTSYLARPHAVFKQTNEYFPGYINQVYRDIAIRDSLQVVRQREEQRRKELEAAAVPVKDSLAVAPDSLAVKQPAADSLAVVPAADTLAAAVADTLATVPQKELTAKELKAQEKALKKAEKERIRAEKEAEREAQWAEEERLEKERQEAKRLQRLEKERARKLKALRKREKKAQKERAIFEKYLEREMKKKNKKQKLAI